MYHKSYNDAVYYEPLHLMWGGYKLDRAAYVVFL